MMTVLRHPISLVAIFVMMPLNLALLGAQEPPSEQQIAAWKTEADKFQSLASQQSQQAEASQKVLLEQRRLFSEQKRKLKSAEETIAKADDT